MLSNQWLPEDISGPELIHEAGDTIEKTRAERLFPEINSSAKIQDSRENRAMADRIQARAVRRMGELYKGFNAQGQRSDQLKEGALQKLTQKEVAQGVGLSEHQAKQAVRVANVPRLGAAYIAPPSGQVSDPLRRGKAILRCPKHARGPILSRGHRRQYRAPGRMIDLH